jgi:hypothetical protein
MTFVVLDRDLGHFSLYQNRWLRLFAKVVFQSGKASYRFLNQS